MSLCLICGRRPEAWANKCHHCAKTLSRIKGMTPVQRRQGFDAAIAHVRAYYVQACGIEEMLEALGPAVPVRLPKSVDP